MRPEIAALVKPIYPDLQNHPSVEKYEPIKGVSSNLFFISHSQPEAHDDETKSHSNLYEAQYLAQLCQYLLKQGYDASRITVLTTYSGECKENAYLSVSGLKNDAASSSTLATDGGVARGGGSLVVT